MKISFYTFFELFKANVKLLYRDKAGFFWTLAMPIAIFVALANIPVNRILQLPISYTTFILPGMIAMNLMQGGIYGMTYWVVEMRARGLIKRLAVTPVNGLYIALSAIVARLAVMFVQVAVLSIVGIVFLHATATINLLYIIGIIALGGVTFLLLGTLLSLLGNSYQAVAPITAGTALIMNGLGNIYFPPDKLPHWLLTISKFLPFSYFTDALRLAYTQNPDPSAIAHNLIILTLWLLFFLLLLLWRFRLNP